MKKELSEIKGFENCTNYIIYDDGRVYSKYSKRFLKLSKDSKGYLYLDLRGKNAVYQCPKIHRLVLLCFGENPEKKEQINHKDGNKLNNHINNLEYVTNQENREHAIITGLKDEYNYYISQHNTNGVLLNIFRTGQEALEYLGIKNGNSGNIGRCIRGKRKTAYGYIWRQCESSTTIEKHSKK